LFGTHDRSVMELAPASQQGTICYHLPVSPKVAINCEYCGRDARRRRLRLRLRARPTSLTACSWPEYFSC